MQTITSAGTSLNQIPALHKSTAVKNIIQDLNRGGITASVIDIGAGKYDRAGDFIKSEYSAVYHAYDPYNRPKIENAATLRKIENGRADVCLCANVLNVINDESALESVIQLCRQAVSDRFSPKITYGIALFSVYEGDKSGDGKETPRGYQRNAPTAAYVPLIQRYFKNVEIHGKIIKAW